MTTSSIKDKESTYMVEFISAGEGLRYVHGCVELSLANIQSIFDNFTSWTDHFHSVVEGDTMNFYIEPEDLLDLSDSFPEVAINWDVAGKFEFFRVSAYNFPEGLLEC